MDQAVKRGGSAIFDFPNENSLPLYLKMNWTVQRGVRRFVRVANMLGLLRRLYDAREKFVPTPTDALRKTIDFGGFDYIPNPHAVSARIDENILDWRFNRHPRFAYDAVRSESNELAVFRPGYRGQISEAELVFVSARKIGTLRRVSKVLTSSNKVDCISIVANDKVPLHAGFIPVPSSINFVRRSMSAEIGGARFDLQPMQIDVT
jgi:hypothetical protein